MGFWHNAPKGCIPYHHHLYQIADELQRKNVNLQVLDQNINTGDARVACCSTCWEPLHSLRQKFEQDARWMASKKPKREASASAGKRPNENIAAFSLGHREHI